MQSVDVQPRRSKWFWFLLTAFGVMMPILVGAMFSFVILTYTGVKILSNSGPSEIVWGEVMHTFIGLSKFGIALSSVLAPLTAIAVPASYRVALFNYKTKPNVKAFVLMMTAFGIAGPVVIGMVLSISWAVKASLEPSGVMGLSAIYAFFGAAVAPLTALVVWPLIRLMDKLLLAR